MNKKEYMQKYYLENKDKFKKRSAEHYSKNKEKYKDRFRKYNRYYYLNNKEKIHSNVKRKGYMTKFHLKKKYGMNESEYAELLLSQSGCCAICGKTASEYKRKLAVDHDHLTGKVRGLLCVKCNGGLGCFEESPLLFEKANEYLRRHNETKIFT